MTGGANLFPALDAATEAALRDSIQRFGVLVPVARDQHGNLLDGFHRSRLADELGVKYRVDVIAVTDEEQAQEIARTLNADRRHLTAIQRREVVAALREQGHSLRAIAGAAGVDERTVRRDLSTAAPAAVPDRITGRDGKPERREPASPKERLKQADGLRCWMSEGSMTSADLGSRETGRPGSALDRSLTSR